MGNRHQVSIFAQKSDFQEWIADVEWKMAVYRMSREECARLREDVP